MSLRNDAEAKLIFEDLTISCDFPAGARHAGSEEEDQRRRAEIWRLGAHEAAAIEAPHLGRPTEGRRRYHRPARGNVECYECDGYGVCFTCLGSKSDRCDACNGTGRCSMCRGAGEVRA